MKPQTIINALFQVLILGIIELGILIGLIFALSWGTRQNWPTVARTAVFLTGFALFALPVIVVTQLPYRKPGWLAKASTGGSPLPATVPDNPFTGAEYQNSPADWMVKLLAHLENGGTSWITLTMRDARRLPSDTPVTICLDPEHPERCALAPEIPAPGLQ